jgi:hypothetical protein
VWTSESATISLTNEDGTQSGCTAPRTWTYDARSGALTEGGCVNGSVINRTLVLSDEQRSKVIAPLLGLRTTSEMTTIADAPQVEVVVTDNRGAQSKYSGYPWYWPPSSPVIDSGSLFLLENLFDSFTQ